MDSESSVVVSSSEKPQAIVENPWIKLLGASASKRRPRGVPPPLVCKNGRLNHGERLKKTLEWCKSAPLITSVELTRTGMNHGNAKMQLRILTRRGDLKRAGWILNANGHPIYVYEVA
jgi:hypothetical protein